MERFELIVIGAGPAGEKAAVGAAFNGKRVLVVEKAAVEGGMCVRGGLPSKMLREVALHVGGIRQHLDTLLDAPSVRAASRRILRSAAAAVCTPHAERVRANLARHEVTVVRGKARLRDAHTVEVAAAGGTLAYAADFVVIATGSRARRPPEVPFDDRRVFASDTFHENPDLPDVLAVVGGGVIGCEYASILATLGVQIHLIDSGARLLRMLDRDVAEVLARAIEARGGILHLGERVSAYRVEPERVRLTTDAGREILADCVLFSGGRVSNVEELGLDGVGVELTAKGCPKVDALYRTTVPSVYAVGDVIGAPALASTSMEQGRLAVAHAFGLDRFETAATLPYGIYTIPALAMVGRTEEQLSAEGIPYLVGVASYEKTARADVANDGGGRVKLVCRESDGRVLGVQIVGHSAEELIHIGQACIHFQGGLDYFLKAVFNFPTFAEVYKYAAYDVLTRLTPPRRAALSSALRVESVPRA